MHSAVLQNKKYIKFASENTVEVMALGRLDEGVEKKDKKAETYEVVDAQGNKVQLLVEFPNLTVDEINKMNSSKAGSYNDTGKIPYTAIVDPFTLEKIEGMSGGMGAGQIIDAVEKAQKVLAEKNGKPDFFRKDLDKIEEAADEVAGHLAKGKLDKALNTVAKIEKSAKGWPELATAKVAKIKATVIDAATTYVDELEKLGESDARGAKSKLAILLSKVKGTDLEARVQGLIEQFAKG
ncbi:MAG: hypothetical protein H6832_06750 [Planctomycetes bacterium]|nr:hypothetical protein [Planctomycetota bacterium]MCB9918085.1 hypothetical protein [Planctomycetota bacterium]